MSPSYITKGHDVVKPTNHRQRPLRLLENHRESISLNHSESLSLRITVKATTVTSNFNSVGSGCPAVAFYHCEGAVASSPYQCGCWKTSDSRMRI
ncbi:uncharacterized protein LOC131594406 isoform X2 [Vicia villosa]|uniref:uncharacterized protein LOC131594406 isoform X2 n=1 Tax=Vicia villosa TaxID=3911 RepID=UPI00273C6E73|nr:uncharacterized protein LOC131594406 isoform X2 [Vicia villosa]